ncbi:MAG: recombination protein RecR [Deltaproteobacteria bacterium]|jgi:recombination protein RecR|nr:recombination protein RecR [Deltaproteobacteria bacterium]
MLPPALDKVATLLSRLPGVGKRSALRWAFHILAEPPAYAEALRTALGELLEHVHFCAQCHHLAETELCGICRDPARDTSLLCVVEGVPDLLALERTGSYRGRYHVLHGSLAPLKGVGPSQLRLDNLESRITQDGVREVIVATSADVEGEATALYLAKRLAATGVSVTRIATGIPMGGELEYLDDHTLSRAIAGRIRLGGP